MSAVLHVARSSREACVRGWRQLSEGGAVGCCRRRYVHGTGRSWLRACPAPSRRQGLLPTRLCTAQSYLAVRPLSSFAAGVLLPRLSGIGTVVGRSSNPPPHGRSSHNRSGMTERVVVDGENAHEYVHGPLPFSGEVGVLDLRTRSTVDHHQCCYCRPVYIFVTNGVDDSGRLCYRVNASLVVLLFFFALAAAVLLAIVAQTGVARAWHSSGWGKDRIFRTSCVVMDSSRWRADPNVGGEGGFQVADPRQHAGVAYGASPSPGMLPFHRGAVDRMQGQAMGVPSGPGMSMPRMQSMIARPRLPLHPAPQTMPVGAGYVVDALFSAQLAGGYAPPGVQSMPTGTAFGISGQVFPASQAMDGGYGCGAEPPWLAPCGQSSRRTLGQSTQPTFGGKSIPSPSSCRRTSSDQSASMIDVDSDDNGEVPADTTGWTPGGVGDGEGTWHDDTGGSSYGADEEDDDDGTSTQPGEMNDEDGGRLVEEGVQGRPGEDANAAKGNQQKRDKRNGRHGSDMVFYNGVTRHDTRVYEVRVNDVHAMDITVGLGLVGNGALSHILLFVHEVVPNRWEGPHRDAVGDTIKYLVSAIAEEFENLIDETSWYDTIFDPPLEGRGYLHGLVDTWIPEDDLRWDPLVESMAKRTVGGDVVGGRDVGDDSVDDDDDDELYDGGDDDDDDDTSSSPSSSLSSSNSSSSSLSTQSSSTSQPPPTSSSALHSGMESMDSVRAECASQSRQ
ncbi:hypothetical protein CBR_g49455 [Chara braunii]|uniref:Uncharacterized protein n=1 Tax=Chara braunii TaxID=69332 RepID=A0A388K4V4_CHABU|nr:hypothetical protein CBR_g49455 [Chara braunii]|eukprot:GBG65092.1 hypothetical protein CBR_g49455 [Chara braunii]